MKSDRSLIWSLLTSGVMVAVWLLFAPAQVGGQASYAIIDGNSMEPLVHGGDLAVLRTTGEYAVGDVVAYRDPIIGLVMHRIVRRDGEHFVLQGDNNSWLDGYHPTSSEIAGELWFFVPRLGKLLGLFSQPGRVAVLSVLLGGIILMTTIVPKKTPPERGVPVPRYAEPRAQTASVSGEALDWLFLFGLIAVLSAVLGVMSFGQPLWQPAEVEIPYQHTGRFEYQAPARGNVYDTETAHTGDPVFFQTSDQLFVQFDYDLAAEAEHAISGTYRLVAVLGERNGWSRTIELIPPTPFEDQFRAEAVLDLALVQNVIAGYKSQTGVERRDYTLTLIPEVTVDGTLAGEELSDTFTPGLEFAVDEAQIWLLPVGDSDPDPARPIGSKFITTEGMEAAALKILGFSIPVSTGRTASLAGFGVGMMGLLMVARRLFAGRAAAHAADQASEFAQGADSTQRPGAVGVSAPAPTPGPVDRLARADLDNLAMLSVPAMTIAMMGVVLAGVLALVVFGPRTVTVQGDAPTAGAAALSPADGGYIPTGGSGAASAAPMIYIPGGTFAMGSDDYEIEAPVHTVQVEPFAIDEVEVTNGQWAACVTAGGCSPLAGGDAAEPVVGVTWAEAAAFCEWRGARLPTEAEWEMAARWDPATGNVSVYPWGDAWDPARLNTCDESCLADDASHVTPGYTDGWPGLAPAGTFPAGASPLGVLDMAGNAAEWVQDTYQPYTTTSQGEADQRVVRGGAWNLEPAWARTTSRLGVPPDVRAPGIGFRCAVSAPEPASAGVSS
jgi:signal peptidase I